MNYDRMFPIWGDKVYKRGFDIPFPFGIMLNSFYCKQGIEISNIHIGLESATDTLGPADLSNVIKFSDVTARAYNLNLRADASIVAAPPHTRVASAQPEHPHRVVGQWC